MKKETIVEWCCALLVLLFVYAALSKYFPLSQFIHDMKNQPFARWFVDLLIWGLPPFELLISIALIVKRTRTIGLWLSFFLMLGFTGYTAAILAGYYQRIPCSCGGVIRELSWTWHLVLNSAFTAISVIGIWLNSKNNDQISSNNYVAA